ncbi:hypothetical protein ACFVJK_46360 [Streptomyces sp. NPDC127172]|uniref:hypothetical protein n=1 Tax=Streptomyces sp. NPDC127172 TaxID=3345382 RepID=UPI0036330E16
MEMNSVFDGLDSQPWAAYDATEIPSILREVTSPDERASREAMYELASHIYNSQTVFPSAPPAVPFIARLAAAGIQTEILLDLLGSMAATESDDEDDGVPPTGVRDAVAAQLRILLPLLAHQDLSVRELAVWAVAQSRATEMALPALLARWRVETAPRMRGDLLFGITLLEPALATELIPDALEAQEPVPVRVSAVLAGLDAGLPWSGEMATAIIDSLPVDQRIGDTAWMMQPFNEVVERLNLRGEVDEAVDLVARALRVHSQADTDAHKEAFAAAEALGDASSIARVSLLPVLLPLLDNLEDSKHLIAILDAWCRFHDYDAVTPHLTHFAAQPQGDLANGP